MRFAYVVGNDDPNDPDPDLDIPFAQECAQRLGLDLDFVNWHHEINWANYDAAIIRSTWDYVPVRDEFVDWIKNLSKLIPVFNSAEIIEWNTNKKYLIELDKLGIPTIPTKYISQGENIDPILTEMFVHSKDLAIKPTVGAGARLAGKATSIEQAKKLVDVIHENNRIAMVQPYLESVDKEGEKAVIIIDGQISHVAIKVPALTQGGHGDAAEVGVLTAEIIDFVNNLKEKLVFWNELLYARVDVVRMDNKLVLMELELTEPWLFMQFRPESADLLFKALQKRVVSFQG